MIKRLIIGTSALVLFTGIIYLRSVPLADTQHSIDTQLVAPIATATTEIPDQTQVQPQTVQAQQIVTPVIPTADDNRADLETRVSNNASERGLDVISQWICIDKIASQIGYDNYQAILSDNTISYYLNGGVNPDGSMRYMGFDGPGTCRIDPYINGKLITIGAS